VTYSFFPATADRWADLEQLFGPRGACSGCWCMYWRLPNAQFTAQKGEANHQALRDIVDSGSAPGILAYDNGQPVGWCSVAPRGEFARLASSRNLRPVDETPVWSVVCFFVTKAYRRKGISVALLNAAAEYVQSQGGRMLEGYPTQPSDKLPDPFVYTGLQSAFVRAGFSEAARPSRTRAIMRRQL